MDKKQEIAALRSLKGDTYFAQFFGEDIEQMCQNITNDFPIQYGTRFIDKAAALTKELNAAKVKAAEDLEDMVANFIKLNKALFSLDFYHYCAERVGKLFIIKCKRAEGYPLTEDEFDYLIRIADKHINPENYQINNQ